MRRSGALVALLSRWPARITLPALVLGLLSILLLGSYGLRLKAARDSAATAALSRLAEQISVSAGRVETYSELDNLEGARNVVLRLAMLPSVQEAWLIDAVGQVRVSLRRIDIGQPVLRAARRRGEEVQAALARLLNRAAPRREIGSLARGRLQLVAEPVRLQTESSARSWLVLLANTEEREREAAAVVQASFRGEALLLLLSVGLGGWLLRSLMLERSAQLQRSAESLMLGGSPQPSGVRGNDELGVVGRAFDAGIERIQRQERWLRLGTACSRALGGALSVQQALQEICLLMRTQPGIGLAVVLAPSPTDAGRCATIVAGEIGPDVSVELLEHVDQHPQYPWRPLPACMQLCQPVIAALDEAPVGDPLQSMASAARLRVLAAVPVLTAQGDSASSALLLGLFDAQAGDRALAEVLDLLCSDIQVGIAHAEAERARRLAEQRESLAMEAAALGAWEWDAGNRELRLSQRALLLLGLEKDATHSLRAVLGCLKSEDARRLRRRLREVLDYGALLDEEVRVQSGQGMRWLLIRGTGTGRFGGEGPGLAGVLIDIDARKQAESALRLATQVIQQSRLGIMVCDAESRIIDVNTEFERITGYSRAEALGRSPRMLSSERHSAAFYRDIWAQLGLSGSWSGELWNRRKNGGEYPQWLTITRIDAHEGQPVHYICQFIDTSDRKAIESRIEFLGGHDLLTGLPRRERLMAEIERRLATPTAQLALLHLDIDRFRRINESLGYEAGDALLRLMATRLQATLPGAAMLSRIGADEFLVLLDPADEAQARGAAAEVQTVLCAPVQLQDRELAVGLSIGVALGPVDGADAERLAAAAELALAAAQASARNDVQLYSPMLAGDGLASLTLESQLRLGLQRDEFRLVFQPQIDLASGALCGYEALVRWQHPERGLLPPGQFIELAERSGLIIALGDFVLREACRVACRLRQIHPELVMSVNVSALQFARAEFIEQVESILSESSLPPVALELELTESVLMERPEQALARFERLRALGLKLAIDDFGTGFSSLAYLGRLRPDRLKIDRSFVIGMEHSPSNRGVVRAILAMAQEFGLSSVAEGVETEAALMALRAMGCQVGQGYFFAKPRSEAELRWPLDGAANAAASGSV
jgi:diguanylate cyclase (GGDEF)-like protein/PAS domain S-box-containing protein